MPGLGARSGRCPIGLAIVSPVVARLDPPWHARRMVGWRRMTREQSSGYIRPAAVGPAEPSAMANSSLVSVYRRSGAYFVVTSAKTTAGLWVHDGEPRRLNQTEAVAADLAAKCLHALHSRHALSHPARHEWSERRRASRIGRLGCTALLDTVSQPSRVLRQFAAIGQMRPEVFGGKKVRQL
jgi:hypothetical protein